jgi:hypothetical protein
MVALNASTTAKKTGAAYNLDVFGATIGAGADAALPNVDVVALECDIQVKGDVARKVGLQVIDVVSSTGRGTSLDAGILIGKQAGARGFDYGIQFGDASEQNLALFYAPTGTIPYAVDFSGVTFSTSAWKGNFSVSGIVIAPLLTPANSTASGVTGSIQWDASFIYVCTTTNNWKRSALSSF